MIKFFQPVDECILVYWFTTFSERERDIKRKKKEKERKESNKEKKEREKKKEKHRERESLREEVSHFKYTIMAKVFYEMSSNKLTTNAMVAIAENGDDCIATMETIYTRECMLAQQHLTLTGSEEFLVYSIKNN